MDAVRDQKLEGITDPVAIIDIRPSVVGIEAPAGRRGDQRGVAVMISRELRNSDDSLNALLDELVEAHLDTIEMLEAFEAGPSVTSHSLYLKGLVRQAKRLVAEHAVGSSPRWS